MTNIQPPKIADHEGASCLFDFDFFHNGAVHGSTHEQKTIWPQYRKAIEAVSLWNSAGK